MAIADSAVDDDAGGADMSAADTGASDTGASDTGASDTGASDTGASDTGASDTGAADTGPVRECPDGPLDESIPNCNPTPIPSSGDPIQDCVDRINQFRWECQCLPPLARWREGEACVAEHSEYDGEHSTPHGGFGMGICSPSGWAQCECPGYNSNDHVISTCLMQMWQEVDHPEGEQGHYRAMSTREYTQVACGFYTNGAGKVWAAQNYQ